MVLEAGLNKLYIIIGSLIILVLFGALVGPFFVDWTAYRRVFEEEASKALGHPVVVAGEADARFLPSPAIRFTNVRVGDTEGQALATIDALDMRLELSPLLRGEFQVSELVVQNPQVSATIDDAGRLDWLLTTDNRRPINPDSVILERVRISDGQLRLVDGRRDNVWVVSDINFEGSARSLLGPYRAEGGFTFDGEPTGFRIATGRTDELGNLRLTTNFTPSSLPVSLSTDGRLRNAEGGPVYDGQYTFNAYGAPEEGDDEPEREAPIRSQGRFSLTSADLELPEFVIALGAASVASALDGNGRVMFGETPRFDLSFRTDQIDLDRSLGQGPAQPARLGQVGRILGQLALATPTELGVAGRLRLDVGSVIVSGGVVQRMTLDASNDDAGWRIDNLEARFPGRSAIIASGRVGPDIEGTGPLFKGRVRVAALQPGRFAAWARPGRNTPGAPPPGFQFQANAEYSRERLLLENLIGSLGQDNLSGRLDLRRPLGARSQLALDINADRLDLEAIDALTRVFTGRNAVNAAAITDNIALNLRATRLVSRETTARDVIVAASLADGMLDMRRVQIDDLAGANLAAIGRIESLFENPVGRLSADLKADTLNGLVALLSPYLAGIDLFDSFVEAAPDLAPADLEAQFSSAEVPNGIRADLRLQGMAGGSPMSFNGRFEGRPEVAESGDINFTLAADSEDSSKLLRQFSLPARPSLSPLPGALSVTGQGSLEAGLFSSLVADLAGTRFNAEGFLRPDNAGPFGFDGSLTMQSNAIGPLLNMAGISVSGALENELGLADDIPLSLASQVSFGGDRLDMEISNADIAGETVRGNGSLLLGGAQTRLVGDFTTDKLNLPWLLSLGLGGDPTGTLLDETLWSSTAFGEQTLSGLTLDVGLRAAELTLLPESKAGNGGLRLTSDSSAFGVEILEAGFAGGLLSGRINVKNSLGVPGVTGGGDVVVDGRLQLNDAALEELVWRRDGRAVALGNLTISTDFEGNGRSMVGLVASLTGGGALRVTNGEVRGINPRAFGSIIRAVDGGLELEEDDIREVFAGYLDAGNLSFDQAEGAFSIVSGTVRARSIAVDAESATSFGGATIDLNNLTLDSEWTLRVDAGADAVVGAEPQVAIRFEGPVEEPFRQLDVAPLTGFLTVRAFEREVERIENLQADILEKERLGRELRLLDQRRQPAETFEDGIRDLLQNQ